MEINELMIRILQEIINENGKAEIEKTLKKLNISKRTLTYNQKKINYLLEKYGQEQVDVTNQYLKYPKGKLDLLTERILSNEEVYKNYVLSRKERKQIIFLTVGLSKKAFTLDLMAEQMNVSKNTVVNDILNLKGFLLEKGIRLQNHARIGYYLEGNELIIRCTLYEYLLSMLKRENNVAVKTLIFRMLGESLEPECEMSAFLGNIEDIIRGADYLRDYEINHNSVEELTYYVLLILSRNRLGKIYREESDFEDISEFRAAERLIFDLREQGYAIADEEKGYIATILLGIRRGNYHEIQGRTTVNFRQMALDIIDKFEDYACVKFDNKPALVEQLLVHVRPMYYRLIYGVRVNNKYYREIQEQSQDYYRITKLVGEAIGKKYGIEITDEELAYLCIYFASWMTKRDMKTVKREDTILIVCGAGVGTSLFVKQQIEELVGGMCAVEMKDVQSALLSDIMKYGLVITTIDLEIHNKKIIRVNPMLSARDKSRILNWINQEKPDFGNAQVNNIIRIVEKYADIADYTKLQVELQKRLQDDGLNRQSEQEIHLRDMISEQTVQVCMQKLNGADAMRIAVMPLVEQGIVGISYLHAIMETIHDKGLYFEILPGILLAHAKPDHRIARVGLAVSVYPHGVCFGEKPNQTIHTIMVLATPSNTAHLNIIKELFWLLRNPDIKSRLQTGDFSGSYELRLQLETILDTTDATS